MTNLKAALVTTVFSFSLATPALAWTWTNDNPSGYNQQDFYKQNLSTIDALAKKVEDKEVLPKKTEVMKQFNAEYDKQYKGFKFEVRRWGDFLEISMRRNANTEGNRTFSKAIQIPFLATISLIPGHAPDTNGEVLYLFFLQNKNDPSSNMTVSSLPLDMKLTNDYTWNVESYPLYTLPESRPFWSEPNSNESNYYNNTVPSFSTKNYPRAEADDEIVFQKLGETLYVPFGLGRSVEKQIMLSTERDFSKARK